MQDEKQFEQLMLQYKQLKNSAEDISRMIQNEDYDSALTMINSREEIFLSCKCIRKFLDLTPVQKKELDTLLNELKELEIKNIKDLSTNMTKVQKELKMAQQNDKFHNAYNFDEHNKGNIINLEE